MAKAPALPDRLTPVDDVPSIARPVPRGVNARGVPTWSGVELQLYRRALGVTQAELALRLAMWQEGVSVIFENRRTPVAVAYAKVVRYIEAVERASAADAVDVIAARADLEAFRATASTAFAVAEPGPQPKVRSRAEAERIRDEQRREEGAR